MIRLETRQTKARGPTLLPLQGRPGPRRLEAERTILPVMLRRRPHNRRSTWELTATEQERGALANTANACATPPKLMASGHSLGERTPGATSTPVPPTHPRQRRQSRHTAPAMPPRQPENTAYRAARTAAEVPKWMVPSARDDRQLCRVRAVTFSLPLGYTEEARKTRSF